MPDVEPARFERNLIKQAVCEIRFPTLLELETKSPIELQKALRKDYPHYDPKLDVELQPGATSTQRRHVLLSKNKKWAVSVRPFAISIEAFAYSDFEDLMARLRKVLDAASSIIDSDFYTRVGLRYVNAVRITQDKIDGWINQDLVAPLAQGVFGTVDQWWQEIRGVTATGRYLFRHGYPATDQPSTAEYLLDLDMYQESIEAADLDTVLRDLHHDQLKLFMWSLGPKAREHLGKATPKGHR